MATASQVNRLLQIGTPLGDEVLLLTGLRGAEYVSRPFHFDLDLLSENPAISFSDIVGKRVTAFIQQNDDSYRPINGIISRFVQSGRTARYTAYHAELVPWLWLLTQNIDCQIFQNQTVPDIITKIFHGNGIQDFDNRLKGTYPTLEYCVQYRESDLNFVSRLMEEYGIFYYFEHSDSQHKLILADMPSAHQPCPGVSTASYETVSKVVGDEDRVTQFDFGQLFRTGGYALEDYNFETPTTDLLVTQPTVFKVANNDSFNIFDYPGNYGKRGDGENMAKVRMQQEEALHLTATGAGNCRTFTAGYTFDLKNHYRRDLNKTYVLTAIQHVASVGDAYDSSSATEESDYENAFECIPSTIPFRPQRTTPKPYIRGPQTAVVVGPSGEEIYVDKYGRVKVQFFWDHTGDADEKSSCWVRVSQAWAGKGWGAITTPRIGQEVIVEFLEGDPDHPIITGRVYNAIQVPPYTLPDMMTRSTFKTLSTKGGGGFNELRFEDKKGSEQIFIHAEKDQDVRTKEVLKEFVGKDANLIVKGSQLEKVDADKHQNVGGDHNQKVGGTLSLQTGTNLEIKAGMNTALDSGMEIHLKAGMNLVIESGMTLTLKAGSNFISFTPAGIAIQGTMVLINSGGAAGSGSGASPTSPKDPAEADDSDPGQVTDAPAPPPKQVRTVAPPAAYSAQAKIFQQAADSGAPFCDI